LKAAFQLEGGIAFQALVVYYAIGCSVLVLHELR
jgi:hypothetical protein